MNRAGARFVLFLLFLEGQGADAQIAFQREFKEFDLVIILKGAHLFKAFFHNGFPVMYDRKRNGACKIVDIHRHGAAKRQFRAGDEILQILTVRIVHMQPVDRGVCIGRGCAIVNRQMTGFVLRSFGCGDRVGSVKRTEAENHRGNQNDGEYRPDFSFQLHPSPPASFF